jgi:hypothetical protein
VINITGRANVLYYELKTRPVRFDPTDTDYVTQLEPVRSLPIAIFPTIGVDVRF